MTARAPDEYEKRYVGKGRVVFRDKVRAPTWLQALLGVAGIAGTAGSIAAVVGDGAPVFLPVVVVGAIAAAWSVMAALRIAVTTREVHVQYGLFGPRIPLDAIESVEAVDYNWMQYGGWGIRRGLDGSTAYNMMGDRGRAVKIVYRTKLGRKTVLLSSTDPSALARAIADARARVTTSALDVAREEHALPSSSTDAVSASSTERVDVAAKIEHTAKR